MSRTTTVYASYLVIVEASSCEKGKRKSYTREIKLK